MFKLLTFIFLFAKIATANLDPDCVNWFQKSKLKSNGKDCVVSCAGLPIDFNTFHCPNKCEELCKKAPKCEIDSFWKNKLKSGKPQKWDIESEKTSEWSQPELEKTNSILSRLPEELKKIPLDGFYRMLKSVVVSNPATTSSNGKTIAVYDRAFNNPFWSMEDVLLHEIGHVSYLNLSESERLSFKNKMGWKQSLAGDSSRNGDFVSERAKDSPEEDFAENFVFFLKDTDFLKSKNIKAYQWFSTKYSINFKYKKECEYEEK